MKWTVLIIAFACSFNFAMAKDRDNKKEKHKHKHRHKNHSSSHVKVDLDVSQKKCTSPCEVTLKAQLKTKKKDIKIKKYIFDLGNDEKIEQESSELTYTYINFQEADKPSEDSKKKYKKHHKFISWIKKKFSRFKKIDKFKLRVTAVGEDGKEYHSSSSYLFVKPSDELPVVDNGDLVPPTPDPVQDAQGLLGLDVDEDGVPDRVELFINKEYKGEEFKEYRVLQKAYFKKKFEVLAVVDDRAESNKRNHQSLEIVSCAFHFMVNVHQKNAASLQRWEKREEVIAFNTRERIKKRLQATSNMNGESNSPYDRTTNLNFGPEMENFCRNEYGIE